MRFRNIGWVLLLFAMILALLEYMYPGILYDPQHRFFSLGGDGIKNEFTYLYHILYGKGCWFEGMNYPFGEHLIYADAQPLLSITLAWLHKWIPISPGGAMAVMEWAIVSSYLLGGFFLWKLLVHLKVDPFPAVLLAFCILFLSPQVLKLNGHYGLAYICAVPMQLYWLLRYHELGRKRYALYLLVLIILLSLLHLYFLAMSLLLTGGYLLYLLIADRRASFRDRLVQAWPLAATLLMAVIALQVFIALTDPIKDRPQTPYGFLGGITSLDEVLKSHYSVIWQGLEEAGIVGGFDGPGEGLAYPGFAVWITIVVLLVSRLVRKVRKSKAPAITDEPVWAPHFLFIGALSLIVAMGIPFIWGLEGIVDRLPLVKQFRTLGRFSWVFYNIVAIYAAVQLYRFFRYLWSRGKKALGGILLFLAIGTWLVEVNGYVIHMRKEGMMFNANHHWFYSRGEQGWPSFLGEHGYRAADFQSIVILPYYHIGTEKIWTGSEAPWSGWEMTLAAKASIALHLPIMDVMMSRSSWEQARQQVKIAAGPYSDKPVLEGLPDRRSILVMVYDEAKLDPDHRYILEGADSLGHYSQCFVYVTSPHKILANDSAHRAALLPIVGAMKGPDTCLNMGSGIWCAQHLDESAAHPFFGEGSRPIHSGAGMLLAQVAVPPGQDSAWYECSIWSLAPKEDYRTAVFLTQFLDSAGNLLREQDMPTKFSTDGEGLWYRAFRYFQVPAHSRTFRFLLAPSDDGRPTSLALDEWQLRPRDAVIISKDRTGRLMVNNHLLKKR